MNKQEWVELLETDVKKFNKTREIEINLRHANLDYSCFPLWCGSFDMKTDMRLVYQLCYHICRMEIKNKNGDQSKTGRMIQKFLMPHANKFHRVNECGEIEYSENKE